MLLPVDLLTADLSATALAVWVLLAEHVRPGRPDTWVHRDTLTRRLGRGRADGCTVSRAVAELTAAGWLDVAQVRRGDKTRNVYRPLGTITADDARRWVDVTPAHRSALTVGNLTPALFRTLARWLYAGGREGWTRDTVNTFRATYGGSPATVKRDRAALVRAGFLEARTDPGRPSITAAPGRLPRPPQTGLIFDRPPGSLSTDHRAHFRQPEVTPVEVTPEEATAPPAARRARHGGDAHEAATAPPPASKPLTRDETEPPQSPAHSRPLPLTDERSDDTDAVVAHEARRAAGLLLAQFPTEYVTGQADRYRAALLARLARALLDGYGPAAILAAVVRNDLPDLDRTAALRAALVALAADVLAGACPTCGHDPDDDRRPICEACRPDRDTLTADERAALLAAGYDLDNLVPDTLDGVA